MFLFEEDDLVCVRDPGPVFGVYVGPAWLKLNYHLYDQLRGVPKFRRHRNHIRYFYEARWTFHGPLEI